MSTAIIGGILLAGGLGLKYGSNMAAGARWLWSKMPSVSQQTTTGGDAKAAMDYALALNAHFPSGSPGRAAMKPVFDAIMAELIA